MKYLVDKSLSPRSVEFLNELGYTSLRIDEVFEKRKVDDEEIYQLALDKGYTIITIDLDFGEILSVMKTNKPSSIVLRLSDQRVENTNRRLKEVLPYIQERLQEGYIVIIEDKRIRSRKLPI